MLTCVYHPIDAMRVLEVDEADKLKATGFWFDSPKKAQEYRSKIEQEIKDEEQADANKVLPKAKQKGKRK